MRGSLGFQQHVLRDHQRQHRIEKVTNLTDESMGLCVLCEITIPRIAIKKNPQLTQQTVNRLKEAFWKLYETKPIEKISVRQITELAGYNHASSTCISRPCATCVTGSKTTSSPSETSY